MPSAVQPQHVRPPVEPIDAQHVEGKGPASEDLPIAQIIEQARPLRDATAEEGVEMALADGTLHLTESAKLRGYDPAAVESALRAQGGADAVKEWNQHRLALEAIEAATADESLSPEEARHLAARARELGISDDAMSKAIRMIGGFGPAIQYNLANDRMHRGPIHRLPRHDITVPGRPIPRNALPAPGPRQGIRTPGGRLSDTRP